MKLIEFVEDVADEMRKNGWEEKEIEFCTLHRGGLDYLSIYDFENKVIIDIGTGADSEDRNKVLTKP